MITNIRINNWGELVLEEEQIKHLTNTIQIPLGQTYEIFNRLSRYFHNNYPEHWSKTILDKGDKIDL